MASTSCAWHALRRTQFAICLLLALCTAGIARAEGGIHDPRLQPLRDAMRAHVEAGHYAGIVTLVAQRGRILDVAAVGRANVDAEAPLREDAIMRIASMTKPITGVALLMLLEEGKWSLDDPVAKHIPEFANLQVLAADGTRVPQATPMTMRQLVSHTAGFAYGLSLGSPVDAMYREQRVLDRGTSLDEMIRKLAALPLAFQPGERWYYSAAVDVQGYLVQKLSGMPFDAFLRTRLFGPLKMVDTDFALTPEQLPRLASIHTHDMAGRLVAAPPVGAGGLLGDPTRQPGLPSGGGGLFSTTHDYYRFCQMLLQGGELDGVRVLQPATVALMHTNQLPPGATVGGGISRAFADLQFGVDVAIVTPAAEAAMVQPAGSYFWGGAFGTWFWIDPVNEVVALFMVQYRPSAPGAASAQAAGRTDVRGEIATLVYRALRPQ